MNDETKKLPILLSKEMANFLLGVLSLFATLCVVMIAISLALIISSVSLPLNSFLKIDIQIFQKTLDPFFVCFLVSILCRIFFNFITWTQNSMPRVVLFLSFLLGIIGIGLSSSLFAYSITHFRHEFYGVTDPFHIFHALLNIFS